MSDWERAFRAPDGHNSWHPNDVSSEHIPDSFIKELDVVPGPLQVQDKFRLDLSDEEAVHYMQSLIDESVHALFAAVVEQIHKFAQVRPKGLGNFGWHLVFKNFSGEASLG